MALHADTVWEVRSGGDADAGGGWHDTGGASTDYSQQDTPELENANHSIAGTTLTDDDGDGSFTDAMIVVAEFFKKNYKDFQGWLKEIKDIKDDMTGKYEKHKEMLKQWDHMDTAQRRKVMAKAFGVKDDDDIKRI